MSTIAFLGCGEIARKPSKTLHQVAPGMARYYASRDAQRADSFARELAGAGSFGSYRDAIESPKVDAVFICTPPDLHLPLAVTAFEAGRHVIVEKPPFLTLDDMDVAIEAAGAAAKLLIVAENYFYRPLAGVIRHILAEEMIGRPLLIQINALKKQNTGDWRDDPTAVGRGALFEGGIHWVNFMANLGPNVVEVTAARAGDQAGLDRSSLLCLRYDNGLVGTLAYSWEVPSMFKGLRLSRIFGTEGSVTFETNGLFVIVKGRRNRVFLPGFSDISGFGAMLKDFTSSLDTGREPLFSTFAARRDMEILEQAYRSMKTPTSQQLDI